MSEDLNGKIALVTGGSRGIGEGIARHLAQLGAHVVLTARSEEAAENVAAAIRADAGSASAATLDIADAASVVQSQYMPHLVHDGGQQVHAVGCLCFRSWTLEFGIVQWRGVNVPTVAGGAGI